MLYNPMTHGAHASLYNPMTHGDLYPLYNVVWPHDPWGFVTIAAPMTHGKKVAEPCVAPGLDLQVNFFQDEISVQDHNLQSLHYPSIETDLLHSDGKARACAHTDYGGLSTYRPSDLVDRYTQEL